MRERFRSIRKRLRSGKYIREDGAVVEQKPNRVEMKKGLSH